VARDGGHGPLVLVGLAVPVVCTSNRRDRIKVLASEAVPLRGSSAEGLPFKGPFPPLGEAPARYPQLIGRRLALLWQILAIDRRNWIPESDFQ
jgi:hypothetical protein